MRDETCNLYIDVPLDISSKVNLLQVDGFNNTGMLELEFTPIFHVEHMRRMFFKVSERFYQFDNIDGFISEESGDNWDTTLVDSKDTMVSFGSDYDPKNAEGKPMILPDIYKHKTEVFVKLSLIGEHSSNVACYICNMLMISNTTMRLSFISYSFDDINEMESNNNE